MPKPVVRSVTTPLEININGADGLQYMQSYSSANGIVHDHVHVCPRHRSDDRPNQRAARRGPHARAAAARPCRSRASAVQKSSGNITIAVAMVSTSSVGVRRRREQLCRHQRHRGPQAHSRVSDKSKCSATAPTACASGSIRTSFRPTTFRSTTSSTRSNRTIADVAPGAIGQAPDDRVPAVPDTHQGQRPPAVAPKSSNRSSSRSQPNGGYLRIGDVAQVELGAQNYVTSARYNGQTAVVLAIEGEADRQLAADLQ